MQTIRTPKLIVCDLDDLMGNRDAESDLLENWIAWEGENRPLLLFHSRLSLDELSRALPITALPPPHFLVGAGISMMVRYTFQGHTHSGNSTRDGLEERLLATVVSAALSEVETPEPEAAVFPRVRLAVLTTAGLSVTFGSSGKPSRRPNPSAVLSWLLHHLDFDSTEVRMHVPASETTTRRLRTMAR
jgi:hypothetical protein